MALRRSRYPLTTAASVIRESGSLVSLRTATEQVLHSTAIYPQHHSLACRLPARIVAPPRVEQQNAGHRARALRARAPLTPRAR